jgi:hypothetical protein
MLVGHTADPLLDTGVRIVAQLAILDAEQHRVSVPRMEVGRGLAEGRVGPGP